MSKEPKLKKINTSTTAYEKDLYKWAFEQSNLLKRREYSKLDVDNLIEEIEALGRSEKRTLESYFRNLLLHLLKIKYQPSHHTPSCDSSIKIARIQIEKTLKENPSLKPKAREIFTSAYIVARLAAVSETGLDEKTFPKTCPWTLEASMGEKKTKAAKKQGK